MALLEPLHLYENTRTPSYGVKDAAGLSNRATLFIINPKTETLISKQIRIHKTRLLC